MPKITCSNCGLFNSGMRILCKRCGAELYQKRSNTDTSFSDYNQFLESSKALQSKYVLVEEIGHGGSAIVYKALQKNTSRTVAVKVIKTNLIHDAESIALFHNEAKNAGSLNHPNIVTIYDDGVIRDTHYIVMEYLDGIDLFKHLRSNGVLSSRVFEDIIEKIANAIQYLHDQEIIHRDIKTANIFLTKEGRPVLMDFGIANLKKNKQANETQFLIGTPEYMSPEQVSGLETDEKTDWYSLGIVMFECLTGTVPFKGSDFQQTKDAIINLSIDPILNIHKVVKKKYAAIIRKSLDKTPSHRYKHASGIIADLKRTFPPFSMKLEKIIQPALFLLLAVVVAVVMLLLMNPFQQKRNTNDSDIKIIIIDVGDTIVKPPYDSVVPPPPPPLRDKLSQDDYQNKIIGLENHGNFNEALKVINQMIKDYPGYQWPKEKKANLLKEHPEMDNSNNSNNLHYE